VGGTPSDRAAQVLAVLGAILAAATAAGAHEISRSTSRIVVTGRSATVVFTIGALDFHAGPAIDSDGDGRASPDEVDAAIGPVFAVVKQHFRLTAAGAAPSAVLLERYARVDGTMLRLDLQYAFDASIGPIAITSTLDAVTQPDHRHLASVVRGGTTEQAVLDASRPEATFGGAPGTSLVTVRRFLTLGMEHIVTGYDHLAFLGAVLVGATTLIEVVKIVTAFTVAHSVTLGLATVGLVALPARLIETLIALSIAWVAAENLLAERVARRWRVTFLFGLVHGFGFSNVLRELALPPATLALSLFAFNLGVEVGQVGFVALAFPLVTVAMRSAWRTPLALASSSLVLCLGVYWFVQRLLAA
jgi:hypothetical protein